MERPFVHRIRERLDATGKSVRKAALDAGLSETALKDLLANEKQWPKLDTLQKLAASLETDPSWLAFGGDEDIEAAKAATAAMPPASLPVVGEVAAGRWLEADDHVDVPLYDPVPVQPDTRWPVEAQYGLVVRGTSLNRVAIDGDILACVDAVTARYRPREDDLIIVEMTRNAGLLRQMTAKRYMRQGTHVELWPDSDDERWQSPIIIPLPEDGLSSLIEDDDGRIEVRIKAMVTWIHRPVQKRRR
ncbi:XRE family transcriptional regulator [Methylorubrum sp. DB1722]|uniref:LexA family transcriptional regulator n=1 Tax=Methylorubrum sp. DB1722 TaxID=2478916 RepID=UPI0018E3F726|nr:XRE family transcriptional regulator [Methylorubrum sp. DB1722]